MWIADGSNDDPMKYKYHLEQIMYLWNMNTSWILKPHYEIWIEHGSKDVPI